MARVRLTKRFTLSQSRRRTPARRIPKITLIAAGSALAVAGVAGGTAAAWWPGSPAPANMADAASFGGRYAAAPARAAAPAQQAVLGSPADQLKAVESRQAAAQVAAAQQATAARARAAATVRAAAKAAAARAAAARAVAAEAQAAAARQAPASAAPPAAAPPATQPQGSPQQIAQGMLGSFGWSSSQFSCLQPLWNAESGWNVSAANPSSGAYGIPQALPGSKMASAGADWQTNPATQIRWGLGYIKSVYGSPCGAWSHEQSYGWY